MPSIEGIARNQNENIPLHFSHNWTSDEIVARKIM